VDLPAILAGVAAIVSAVGGTIMAIREVRRRERRDANRTIRLMENYLNDCQAENVELHREIHRLRVREADQGINE
jgi:hypothetical protein